MDGLKITLASFDKAMDLQEAVGNAIKNSQLTLDIKADKKDIMKSDISSDSIGSILKTLIGVGVSREVKECIFKCAETTLYNNEKVNKDFFEKEENRKLYYPIMFEIAKANLDPFMSGLFSMLNQMGLSELIGNILK